MRTLSVQVMPNGFEVETPPFSYWVKAGLGFAFGTAIAIVVLWVPMFYLYLRFVAWFLTLSLRALQH